MSTTRRPAWEMKRFLMDYLCIIPTAPSASQGNQDALISSLHLPWYVSCIWLGNLFSTMQPWLRERRQHVCDLEQVRCPIDFSRWFINPWNYSCSLALLVFARGGSHAVQTPFHPQLTASIPCFWNSEHWNLWGPSIYSLWSFEEGGECWTESQAVHKALTPTVF